MGKQALEGTRLNAFGMDPNDLVIIGHDTKDGPEHPLFDERANLPLSEEMVNNIMFQGVLETVLVRKNGDAVEVVAGRQRVKNAREANKRLKKQGSTEIRVPVMVRKGDDSALLGVSISENEVRRDDTPSIKAEKLTRYLATGRSEQEAAVTFGVSVQTIKNWSKMADLDVKVRNAVDAGKIPASAAWNLAGLSREDQRAELDKLLVNGKATVKGTQRAVKNNKKKRRGGGSEDGVEVEAPGKRLVFKVLKLNDKLKRSGDDVLSPDFIKGIEWVLGEIGPSSIGGLTDLIRKAQEKKAKKAAEG